MTIDVIVAYAVGERSQEDGWKKLCVLVHNTSLTNLPDVLKNIEAEYKEKFNAPLPSAYRSAKSTAVKAANAGVSLLNEDGSVKGKTAVSKECAVPSAAKSRSIPLLVDAINKALDEIDEPTKSAYIMFIKTNVKGLV